LIIKLIVNIYIIDCFPDIIFSTLYAQAIYFLKIL
jgi:hypothetical protein